MALDLTHVSVDETKGIMTVTLAVDGEDTEVPLVVSKLRTDLEAKDCDELVIMLRGLYPAGRGAPQVSGTQKSEYIQGILYAIQSGRLGVITQQNPQFFSKTAKESCYSIRSSWETIVVCALLKQGNDRAIKMNNLYKKKEPECLAKGQSRRIFGVPGVDDCPAGTAVDGWCCAPLVDKLTFLSAREVASSCEACEDMDKGVKSVMVKAFEQDQESLDNYASSLNLSPSQQDWLVSTVAKIQHGMFGKLSAQFTDLFNLVEIDSCSGQIGKKYLQALEKGTWKGSVAKKTSWTLAVLDNPIGYGLWVMVRFVMNMMGMAWNFLKTVGGKIWSLAQWYAAYVVYNPKQTKIILYVLNRQKTRLCQHVGQYLYENGYLDSVENQLKSMFQITGVLDVEEFRQQKAAADEKAASRGTLSKVSDSISDLVTGAVDAAGKVLNKEEIMAKIAQSDVVSSGFASAGSMAASLLKAGTKLIPVPFLGDVAGAAIDITVDMTTTTMTETAQQVLAATEFQADLEQIFAGFMDFIDFNVCLAGIPGVKSRLPNLINFSTAMLNSPKSVTVETAEYSTYSIQKEINSLAYLVAHNLISMRQAQALL